MDQVSFQNGFACGMATRGLVRSREYSQANMMIGIVANQKASAYFPDYFYGLVVTA